MDARRAGKNGGGLGGLRYPFFSNESGNSENLLLLRKCP